MKPLPKWGIVLVTAVNSALYVGLAAWGWGGWSALMAHPARAGAIVTVAVLSVLAMFTRGNSDEARAWMSRHIRDFRRGYELAGLALSTHCITRSTAPAMMRRSALLTGARS